MGPRQRRAVLRVRRDAVQERPELMLPMYLLLLLMFFAYCYPIARLTMALERRFNVKG